MKPLKPILILFLLIVAGCWLQDNWYSSYNIVNETDYDLTIITFKDNIGKTPIIIDTIIINPRNRYQELVQNGEEQSCNCQSNLFNSPDSCYVLFNNLKRQRFYRHDPSQVQFNPNKNILIIDMIGYTEDCSRKHGCDYTYTITEEDYLNAEPIE